MLLPLRGESPVNKGPDTVWVRAACGVDRNAARLESRSAAAAGCEDGIPTLTSEY